MHVLAVGSGPSGAFWDCKQHGPYDLVVAMNGSVLNGGHFDHYVAMDKHTSNEAEYPDFYDYFRIGVERATLMLLHPRSIQPAAEILAEMELDPRYPNYPQILPYFGSGSQRMIEQPPGHHTTTLDGKRVERLACHGTGLHSILHWYSWQDWVSKITLLGFEHSLHDDGRMHFYGEEPLDGRQRKMWDERLKVIVRASKEAVELAQARVPVDIHTECGGRLRDALTA